ncbi:LysE family transporter [Gellertiella hungarica]|uniref:Threonine/homoserine/homoserine lactone efflux protein n=1 Tax=Gellertiella hungarica TaxID=1572859 RepID=A0A7W6NLH6_9HYPH|nr:threonine/homoserine/homoserine lactone efflux protein [Gellertiella hungarica]
MPATAELSPLLLGWGAYVAATASPGPGILTIVETAVSAGRAAGLARALGVLSGSMTWAALTTIGVSALIHAEPGVLTVVQLIGGSYLMFLAWGMARKAMKPGSLNVSVADRGHSLRHHYAKGYGVHLTNPKAIMAWIMLTSLALPPGSGPEQTLLFVGGCLLLGLTIFAGFALLFSIPAVHAAYLRQRRPLEAGAAAFFAYAGAMLLRSAL